MSLLQWLLESINQEWENQPVENIHGEVYSALTIAYINPSLEKAIKLEGDEVPTKFDPNKFNDIDEDTYCTVEIRVCTGRQDTFLDFYYE